MALSDASPFVGLSNQGNFSYASFHSLVILFILAYFYTWFNPTSIVIAEIFSYGIPGSKVTSVQIVAHSIRFLNPYSCRS